MNPNRSILYDSHSFRHAVSWCKQRPFYHRKYLSGGFSKPLETDVLVSNSAIDLTSGLLPSLGLVWTHAGSSFLQYYCANVWPSDLCHLQVRLRCQKGVPPSLRGRAWLYLSGGKVKKEQNTGKFEVGEVFTLSIGSFSPSCMSYVMDHSNWSWELGIINGP